MTTLSKMPVKWAYDKLADIEPKCQGWSDAAIIKHHEVRGRNQCHDEFTAFLPGFEEILEIIRNPDYETWEKSAKALYKRLS